MLRRYGIDDPDALDQISASILAGKATKDSHSANPDRRIYDVPYKERLVRVVADVETGFIVSVLPLEFRDEKHGKVKREFHRPVKDEPIAPEEIVKEEHHEVLKNPLSNQTVLADLWLKNAKEKLAAKTIELNKDPGFVAARTRLKRKQKKTR